VLGNILDRIPVLVEAEKLVGHEVVRSASEDLVAEVLEGHVRRRLGFDFVLHALIITPIQHYARGLGLFLVALSACPIRGRGRRKSSR